MVIKQVLLLHLGDAPCGKKVLRLAPGEAGVDDIQHDREGIVVNGEHLYPWPMVMRVDYGHAAFAVPDVTIKWPEPQPDIPAALEDAARAMAAETHREPVPEFKVLPPADKPAPKKCKRGRRKAKPGA
jgi:hypothetical protein